MTAKIIVSIVAALGLGFAGTYFATSNGGGCSDGSCPISKLFGLDSSTSKSDCCAPASECCEPASSCCSSGKTAAATKASCCSPAQACCETGEACCKDKAAVKSEPKPEPVSTPAK
ncbi:hypothetical protein BH11PLA2_BH11PLA2_15540 [soil metagenome]